MRSPVKDTFFIGICLAVMVTAFILLYADLNRKIDRSSTEVIGTVVFKKKLAERKFASQVLWGRIENNSPVYNYDSLRTDEDSLAVVYLNDGTEIELNSNTLVLLVMKDKGLDIKLDGGALSARRDGSGRGESSLNISSGKSNIEMKTGGITVAGDSGSGVYLNVTSGSASVITDADRTVVSENNALAIDAEGQADQSELKIRTLSPLNSSLFITAEKSIIVSLSWADSLSGDSSYELAISKDPFIRSSVVLKKNLKDTSASVDLASGSYFWKVKSKKGESAVSSFTVIRDSVPRQIMPVRNQVYNYTLREPLVNFQWGGGEFPVSYMVEVFSDPDMKNPAASIQSGGTAISTDKLPSGDYYWRVRSVYRGNTAGSDMVSPLMKFSIVKTDKLLPPVPADDGEKRIVSSAALRKGSEYLKWSSVPGAEEYEVEIARGSGFNDVAVSVTVKYNYFNLPSYLTEGDYQWRVKSSGSGMKSDPSEHRSFSIKSDVSPVTTYPPDKGRVVQSDNGAVFSWSDPNRGEIYMIEVSGTENFSEPLARERVASVRRGNIRLKPGRYFWRVVLLDENERQTAVSNTAEFTVVSENKPPAIISPAINTKFYKTKHKNITFRWRGDRDSTHYRVSVHYLLNGEKRALYNAILPDRSFVLNNLNSIPEADYTWEVSGLREQRGEYVNITGVSSGSFSVIKPSKVSVPEIRLPDVLIIK